MIIFNEKRYVEERLLTSTGKIESNKELLMFIRYYIALGYDKNEIWKMSIDKTDENEAVYDIVRDDFLFSDAYDKAIKRKQYENEPTVITECEYDWIRQVDDVEKEKILFTLLVIQRFLKLEFIKITYKDLKKVALTKKQSDAIRSMIDELQTDGYLKRITDKTYGVTMPPCNDSNEYIVVSDYNHISAPYLHTLRNSEYFYCEWCGKRVKINNQLSANKKVYCEKCSKIVHKERYRS